MIRFIKSLFSGILSFLTGLVGGKKFKEDQSDDKAATVKPRKSRGYFLELNEADEAEPVKKIGQVAEGTVAKIQELATVNKSPKTPETATANKSPKTQKPAQPAQPTQVELVQTAEGVKAELAKPKPAIAADANGQKQTETTFAPKYLIPSSSNSRRRPGPNMNPFLDMARQVRNPS